MNNQNLKFEQHLSAIGVCMYSYIEDEKQITCLKPAQNTAKIEGGFIESGNLCFNDGINQTLNICNECVPILQKHFDISFKTFYS